MTPIRLGQKNLYRIALSMKVYKSDFEKSKCFDRHKRPSFVYLYQFHTVPIGCLTIFAFINLAKFGQNG